LRTNVYPIIRVQLWINSMEVIVFQGTKIYLR